MSTLRALPASSWQSLRLRASGWSLLVDGGALAAALLFGFMLATAPISSGDYGQWLMVSRFYSGEEVPAYREIAGIAPLMPALLGALRLVLGDPLTALEVLRLLAFAALALGFYTAGATVARSRAGGLLALVFAFVLTDRFLELFAFGGLLQVAAMSLLLLGIAALARAGSATRHERAWWAAAGVAIGLAILSHAGSVVIAVPAALAVGAVSLLRARKRRQPAEWIRFLAPAALFPAAALVFWLVVLVPANQGYAENPAVMAYRGPDALLRNLTGNGFTRLLLAAGGLATAWGLLREAGTRRPAGYCLVAAWGGVTWAIFGATAISGTPTDYPRFATPLLAPLIVAAAMAAAGLLRWLAAAIRAEMPELGREEPLAVLCGALFVLVAGPPQLDVLRSYSGVANRDSIETLARWADEHLPAGEGIVTVLPRDGKWVEGFTGRAALFSNQTRYSFRANEWERSVAADAIVRSTTAVVNGLVGAKYLDLASAAPENVPRELLISMNHDGEWADLVRMPERRTLVVADDGTATPLASLRAVGVQRYESHSAFTVRTTLVGHLNGAVFTWTRRVSIPRDGPLVEVDDEISSPVGVSEIQLPLNAFGPPLAMAEDHRGTAVVRFPRMGRREPAFEVSVTGGDAVFEQTESGLVIRVSGSNHVRTRFRALTTGAPISAGGILFPAQLLEDYNIGAAILRRDGALEPRRRRLEAIGMCVAAETPQHVLLRRDCLPPGSAPSPDDGVAPLDPAEVTNP